MTDRGPSIGWSHRTSLAIIAVLGVIALTVLAQGSRDVADDVATNLSASSSGTPNVAEEDVRDDEDYRPHDTSMDINVTPGGIYPLGIAPLIGHDPFE